MERGLLVVKEKGMTISYRRLVQVFGNIFERRESKCCGIIMKHRRKLKGEQVSHQLSPTKTQNINVIPEQLFCRK